MQLLDIITEKYDKKHKCKTPGANYTIGVHSDSDSIKVTLPTDIQIPDDEASELESDLHYAIEKVLAKFF